jgi:hypothetical protein
MIAWIGSYEDVAQMLSARASMTRETTQGVDERSASTTRMD